VKSGLACVGAFMSGQRRREGSPSAVTLPITPMLDVTFQLLFFFLATFNPNDRREAQLDLLLPATLAQEQVAHLRSDAARVPIEATVEVTLRILGFDNPLRKGDIRAFALATNVGEVELRGSREERETALDLRLKDLKAGDARGRVREPAIKVVVDSEMRWEEVVRVLDICRANDFGVKFAVPGGGRNR